MPSRFPEPIEEQYDKIIKTIDTESIDKLKTKWRKYHVFLKMQIQIAILLKLHEIKPINILDISTGAGYFPYVARYYRHNVKTTDVPKVSRNYTKIRNIIGVELDYRLYIKSYRKLPDFNQKFDMITMLSTIFNQHWSSMKQWNFFLDDLFQYVNPGGSVFINSNKWPSIDLLIKKDPRPVVINPYQVLYENIHNPRIM